MRNSPSKSDKPIRVLLTVPELNPTASPYNEIIALARYLPKQDFALTVCALRKNGLEQTGPELDALGIPYFVARFRTRSVSYSQLRQTIRDQRIIAQHGPYDVQHSMDFSSSPLEAIFAKVYHRPFIRQMRNLNENGHKRMLQITLRLSARVVAISNTIEQFLLELGIAASKIVKIYNGIDLLNFDRQLSPNPAKKVGYFLVVAHIQRRKRLEDAIQALAVLVADYPYARLGLVGNTFDPDYSDELRHLVNDLNIAAHVDFLGPRRDVPALLQEAEALLLCSDSEALGWVAIEAMAARIPVIASKSGGPEEIVIPDETGYLVSVGDIQGYVSAMKAVLTQADKAESMGKRGRQHVENVFASPVMVQRIAEVYRSVARNNPVAK